jgi:hypothetical protein
METNEFSIAYEVWFDHTDDRKPSGVVSLTLRGWSLEAWP